MPIVNGFWVEPTPAVYVPPEDEDGGGPQTLYVQPTDPGAVGAGKLWVDTTDFPLPPVIRFRSTDDDAWFDVLEQYTGLGPIELISTDADIKLERKDAGDVIRSEIILTEGGATTTARDAAGTVTAVWDGFTATLYDEESGVRMASAASSGTSGDTNASAEWTIKNAAGTDKARLTLNETGIHAESNGVAFDLTPQTVYVQPTDPGAVGVGKLWVNTTTDPPFIVRRGVGDDEWVDLLSAYVAAARETIGLTGGAGAAGDSGGPASLTGGVGDDGATNGAWIIAEAGGETDDGYLRMKTPGIGGGAVIFGATGTVPVNANGTGRVGWGTLANISADGLPTSDPAVDGALWNDTGTLKVSAG